MGGTYMLMSFCNLYLNYPWWLHTAQLCFITMNVSRTSNKIEKWFCVSTWVLLVLYFLKWGPQFAHKKQTLFQALWELCILKYKCPFGKPKDEWRLVISRGNMVCWASQMVGAILRKRHLYKLTFLHFHCNCIIFNEGPKVMWRGKFLMVLWNRGNSHRSWHMETYGDLRT